MNFSFRPSFRRRPAAAPRFGISHAEPNSVKSHLRRNGFRVLDCSSAGKSRLGSEALLLTSCVANLCRTYFTGFRAVAESICDFFIHNRLRQVQAGDPGEKIPGSPEQNPQAKIVSLFPEMK